MASPRLARSLVTLRSQVNALWPGRPTGSDGWIGDTAHAGRPSDHNPNAAGVVHALDLTEWVQDGVEMNDVLAEALRASRDPRIKYVISDGRMFSSYATSTCKPWTWRAYSGVNAHTKHVHVSVVAGTGDRSAAWDLPVQREAPRTSRDRAEENELTPAEMTEIKKHVTGGLDAVLAEMKRLVTSQDEQIKMLRRDLRELGKEMGLEVSGPTDGVVGN